MPQMERMQDLLSNIRELYGSDFRTRQFPNLIGLDQEAKNAAQRDWRTNLFQTLSGRAQSLKQPRQFFDPHEIQRGLRVLFRLNPATIAQKPRLIVFAGYTGHFSRSLQEAGFDVLHTDPVPEFSKADGVKSQSAYFHNLPRKPNTLAHISFEGFPAILSSSGYPGIMRSLADTSHGLVMVESRSYYEDQRRKYDKLSRTHPDTNRRELFDSVARGIDSLLASGTPIEETSDPIFLAFKNVYGLHFDVVQTPNFFMKRLHASPEAREKVVFDLQVLDRMQKIVNTVSATDAQRIHSSDAELVPFLAERMKVKPSQIRRALKRIRIGFLAKLSWTQHIHNEIVPRLST